MLFVRLGTAWSCWDRLTIKKAKGSLYPSAWRW